MTRAADLEADELCYSCLLIPRFPDHYLAGDITDCLVEWMKQICISYGWRLGAVVVRPGYLHWVLIVPFNSNPAQFMRLTLGGVQRDFGMADVMAALDAELRRA